MSREKSRLGGGGGRKANIDTPIQPLNGIHINRLDTMWAAMQMSRRQLFKRQMSGDNRRDQFIDNRPVVGDAKRLEAAVHDSAPLIEAAIAFDQRLARKGQWRRRDEGEYVDSGLLASGDDQPFYKRSKLIVNDATEAGEPIRIVISTDDNTVPPGTAAAFIATARIVLQFCPLEIWWQGSWLTRDKTAGFINIAPLVQGTMDFTRLEFCINDPARDTFSFKLMTVFAILEKHMTQRSCGFRATGSYLGKPAIFVSHTGIDANAESIAWNAARWLGWEPVYYAKWNQEEL